MHSNRIIFYDEAIFSIENVSFIAISEQSYAIEKCIIKHPDLQGAINIVNAVHTGISSEFIKKHCTSAKRRCSGYTEKFSEYEIHTFKDEESDSLVMFVKCEKTIILRRVYRELMFALWRRDEKSFYFQLITKNVSSLWKPYQSLWLNEFRNKTIHYTQSAKSDTKYEVVLGNDGNRSSVEL